MRGTIKANQHGTRAGYAHGCRCHLCLDAKSDYAGYGPWQRLLIKTHGPSGYRRGCRCETCRAANTSAHVSWAKRARSEFQAGHREVEEHGHNGYALGCRCDECRWAKLSYMYPDITRPNSDLCECCKKRGRLVADHDHATGKFRGRLCYSCNTGIGKLGDSIQSLERALEYLEGLPE